MKTSTVADRVSAVRGWLASASLDALLVPMADEFQSEWVPEHSKRLRWLTGFSGSFALAAIGRNSAVTILPGMYELQGRAQVNIEVFELEVARSIPFDIGGFAEALGSGARIACDARLVTPQSATQFEDQVARVGVSIHWLDDNPIDALWQDRPPATTRQLFVYPDENAGESAASKRARLGEQLQAEGADCAVLTLSDSVCWLLNVRGHDGPITPFSLSYVVLKADGTVDWFVETEKLTEAVRVHVGAQVALHPLASFWSHLKSLGGLRVLIEETSIPYAALRALESGGAVILRGADPCQKPKAAKNPVEIEGMRRAHVRDGAALSRYLCWLETELRSGRTPSELEAAARLTALRAEDPHFFGVSFLPISAAGEHAALPHYIPDESTNAQIRANACYLIDSGGQYLDGGTTDVTRTIWLQDPPRRFCDEFTRVLKGYLAIDMQRFPQGTAGAALDSIARQYLWDCGKDYAHGTGHGVGAFLHVHEGPQRISAGPQRAEMEAGNILSNEPGYYREGEYGIRIENLVLVKPQPLDGDEREMLGMEPLTLVPIDTRLVVLDMLSNAEIAYLNRYHSRVLDQTGPLVDETTHAWLVERCAALDTRPG